MPRVIQVVKVCYYLLGVFGFERFEERVEHLFHPGVDWII